MTGNGWMQIIVFFLLVLAVTKPLGVFMTRVFSRERTLLDPVLRPLERLIYRVTGVEEEREMGWKEYAFAMLLFSAVSMLLLYAMERLQGYLPFNPQKLGAVSPAPLAFMSAAVGIVLAIVFIRGIARREMKTIGNFWVDLVRCTLWVLLPVCVVGALALVWQGVPQNLKPYDTVKLVEPMQVPKVADGKPVLGPDGKQVVDTVSTQTIAQGPVASQEIIKEFGTNGGGFFNAN